MKSYKSLILFVICLMLSIKLYSSSTIKIPNLDEQSIEQLITGMTDEINDIKTHSNITIKEFRSEIKAIVNNLASNKKLNNKQKLDLLIRKDILNENINNEIKDTRLKIQKVRYLKGITIIKLLYEKVLSLDHHFTTVMTFNEISKLSNPNNYQEFVKSKEKFKQSIDEKNNFTLTGILGNNLYVSVIDSFVKLATSKMKKDDKDASLKEIECILDFTLRMNNDLNTIFFETFYLIENNKKINNDLIRLFEDYTKPVEYSQSLINCRNKDDWSSLTKALNTFLEKIESNNSDATTQIQGFNMEINLNFSIDRLVQYINVYNDFINECSSFYEKFSIILNSYENESQCNKEIPTAYHKLKDDIKVSIQKFENAYRPIEINGSKLKELLYGINEYGD